MSQGTTQTQLDRYFYTTWQTQLDASPSAGVSPNQQQEIEDTRPLGSSKPQIEVPSDSTTLNPAGEDDQGVITSIRTTDIAFGLGRIPIGFYAVVQHSSFEWRTEIKCPSVDDDVIEWNGDISIPSDLSAVVCFGIYASFELQPTLGDGERLRKLKVTVEQLLDHNAKKLAFNFSSDDRDEDIVFPSFSLLVSVGRRNPGGSSSSAWMTIGPCRSVAKHLSQLEAAISQGHTALSRYIKRADIRHLEDAIEHFDLALNNCPLGQPCRAATQSIMAMAKFMHYQADHTNQSLDVPLALCQDALGARPVGHPDRLSTLILLAIIYFAWFQGGHDEANAARAEEVMNEVMNLSSKNSHENQTAFCMLKLHAHYKTEPVQANNQKSMEGTSSSVMPHEDLWRLGDKLLDRFGQLGNLDDLRQAILFLKTSVWYTPAPSCRYRTRLTSLGTALLQRSRFDGDLCDLEQAILRFRDAVHITPVGHPDRPSCLCNLANSFRARFERLGELSDLEQAIARQSDAIDLFPDGHVNRAVCFTNLGNYFLSRFGRLGELNDLERAISSHRSAVDGTPDSHPHKSIFLNNLGLAFSTRFKLLGEQSDVNQAISSNKEAVNRIPDGHPNKLNFLNNLGCAILARFEKIGELGDLEEAISNYLIAVDLTPKGHNQKIVYLNSLANSFLIRFEYLGEPSDLERAISILEEAVGLVPDGDPKMYTCLFNLGTAFLTRFERLGQPSDLEQAISTFEDVVHHVPRDHSDKPLCLNHLGSALKARFERFGNITDLEQAISRQRDAINLIPDVHPNKSVCLINLGNSFLTRFEHFRELDDLEQALLMHKSAIVLAPNGHSHKVTYSMNLGYAFRARFEYLGDMSDLDQAISIDEDTVRLIPDGHHHKVACLNNLGNSFFTRFKYLGDTSDLEQAISNFGIAVNLVPDGQSEKPRSLSHLGIALFARFEHLGELSDLERAISSHREAVRLTPNDHPEKPVRLSHLGAFFRVRFRQLGEMNDLERAISRHEEAVGLTSDSHPRKFIHRINLGNALFTRFDCLGDLDDLEKAISRYTEAVNILPDHHPRRIACLSNLGVALTSRFERLGEANDIDQAILNHKNALGLARDGHSDKPLLLNNLANAFNTRFQRLGVPSDLEQAILSYKGAVHLTPNSHSDKAGHLYNLGNALKLRFDHLDEPRDLEQAMSLYLHAACAHTGPISTRFHASRRWIQCARALGHNTLLHAYSVAISLLPQLAWIGLPLSRRYDELVQGADVVRDAAAAALDLGFLETAVEWLEQGRSIVWGELFQLRSPYDELSSAHPDHARRLRQLSAALENASTSREKTLSLLSEQLEDAEDSEKESLEEEAGRHRALAIERDALIQEIRELPGFERFLLHKEYSQLRGSAHSGPVVIINAAEDRCDALIILGGVENVIHAPLRNFPPLLSTNLQASVKSLIRDACIAFRDERVGQPIVEEHSTEWERILSALWKCAIKPVLDSLAFVSPGTLSRIFWCPTGPLTFLPIHAAGFYDAQYSEPGHKIFDFIVSSYVPTLGTLLPSSNLDTTSHDDLSFLAVRQPQSDGLAKLPGVDVELRHIREVINSSPSTGITLLESSEGTVEEVLELMKKADWVHFACHGSQDAQNPTQSGLCLANKRSLKLSDIISLSRPRGGLAFLSACQTATGDKHLADEAVHIAAGMLFAGYGGVIGTMWSISDRLAPRVAKDVYEQLLRNGTRPDCRGAARALQNAVVHLREGGASFLDWLPFIHVGL